MKNVIFIHGFLGSAVNWGQVSRLLGKTELIKQHEFFALNLRGHNYKSKFASNGVSLERQIIDDLLTQLADLPNRQNVYVCHSYGLRPILQILSQRTDESDVLVVEDASPQISETSYRELKIILEMGPNFFKSREEARQLFTKNFNQNSQLVLFLLSHLRFDSTKKIYSWDVDRKLLSQLLEEAFAKPLWTCWQSLSQQVFFIYGDSSEVANQHVLSELWRYAPRNFDENNCYKIQQSGHWVHHDQAIEFVNVLVNILSSI